MKTQLKKSLSLFLAVLMVLSCWVWVAPEKAEAAAGQYYVKYIVSNISEAGNNGKWSGNSMTINFLKQDGTTGTKSISLDKSKYTSTGANKTIWEGYVDGFPTSIGWYMKMEWKAAASVYLNVRGAYFLVGKDAASCTHSVTKRDNEGGADCFKWQNNAVGQGTKEGTLTIYALGDANPYINSLSALSDTTVSCPEWNTPTVNSTTKVTPTVYDQYDVEWPNLDISYILAETEKGNEDKSSEENGMWVVDEGKTGYAKISAAFQENVMADSNGKKERYLVATCKKYPHDTDKDDTVSVRQKITINYTKVKYTFNADGSISGLKSKIYTDKNQSKLLGTSTYAPENYYGFSADFPKNDSVFAGEGYTFLGFWTKQQPSSGDAYYYTKEADFAKPCTSEEYAAYKAMSSAVEKNGVVTVPGEGKFYDAGQKFDEKSNSIAGNKTYYGWWSSNDITVKFYDIDGKFLGEHVVKYGQAHSAITWPSSKYSQAKPYVSGAYTVIPVAGEWVSSDGTIYKRDSETFKAAKGEEIILIPRVGENSSFKDKYKVTFINPGAKAPFDGYNEKEYFYRDLANVPDIKDSNTNYLEPSEFLGDVAKSYTFAGWTTVAPKDGKYYHVLVGNTDFDEANNAIGLTKDWVVRSDATYYAVYRSTKRTYAVEFVYSNTAGEQVTKRVEVTYGDKISAPIAFIPYSYAKDGFGYTFVNWQYTDKNNTTATFNYADEIAFTKENIKISIGADVTSEVINPIYIYAAYTDGVPTPYTVTFTYKDADGKDVTREFEVKNGNTINTEKDVISQLAPVDKYDNGEALVRFMGEWAEVVDGVVTDNKYTTEALKNYSPTSHIKFEAVYGDPQNYYTVTYVDGANSYSERILVGSKLPQWLTNTGETDADGNLVEVPYLPTMASNEKGDYVFEGWFDEKQTSADFTATNGKKYDESSLVTGNLTLYPQFIFKPKTYTITFLDYEGKVPLANYSFEYGQNIEWLIAEANKAAQSRDDDKTYNYTFIGWDKAVPTICEGKDMTFVAQYKQSYNYYDVKWYNSKLENGNWVADKSTTEIDGKLVETNLLATTHHTYNSKLNAPSVGNLVCNETAEAGQNYVFAGWYYNDENGNAVKYERGMLVTSEMELYATFTLTAKLYTVTTIVKGKTATYEVAGGATADIVPTPKDGYVDTDKHDKFKGWKTADNNEFDIKETAITGNITIEAVFEESAHEYNNRVLNTPATYYEEGSNDIWCSCDAEKTLKSEPIAILKDNDKPVSTIYLGELGKWSSEDTIGAAATDGDEVSLYANANTDVMITASDAGIGVKLIRAFVFPAKMVLTAQNYSVASQIASNVFTDNTQAPTNNANYFVQLSDFKIADLIESTDENGNLKYEVQYEDGNIKTKDLVGGETYIIYYFVNDKATEANGAPATGNQLNTKVRTAKFVYDITAPTVTITDANGETIESDTYCEKAIVTNIEEGATLKINGKEVELNGATSYDVTGFGVNNITITDKAGNSQTKKITVVEHSIQKQERAATCTEGGYKNEVCIVCNKTLTNETYEALGHKIETTHVDATCEANGYDVEACTVCGYTSGKIIYKEGTTDAIYPATGHTYAKDAEGKDVYKVIKASTCSTTGTGEKTCTVCYGKVSFELDTVADAHKWSGNTVYVAPTCDTDGYTYKVCKYCGVNTGKLDEFEADDHNYQWVVETEATCAANGTMIEKCTVCEETRGEATDTDWVTVADGKYTYVYNGDEIVTKTEGEVTYYQIYRLPKTNKHNYKITDEETDTTSKKIYECTVCGITKEVVVDKVVDHKIKFVNEDGTPVIVDGKALVIIKKTNETLNKADINVTLSKADSDDGMYKYTFAGWTNEADNKIVALPLEVTADMTLKATFAQSTKLYTHQFVVPTEFDAETKEFTSNNEMTTLIGAIGDVKKASATPVFSLNDTTADANLKKNYTFEFVGWKDASGNMVEDFEVSKDKTFTAVFSYTAKTYKVSFYSYGINYLWSTTVEAGSAAVYGKVDANGVAIVPTKESTDKNHYSFNTKWYTDAGCKFEYKGEAITADTTLYAGFDETPHVFESKVIREAECTLPEIKKFSCACGYEYEKETENSVLGHIYKESEKDGVTIKTCERCGHEVTGAVKTFLVKFVNANNATIETIRDVAYGSKVDYKAGTPTQADTVEYTYTFKCWVDEEGKEYSTEAIEAMEITENYIFTAKYTATKRMYRVTYVDVNNNALMTDMYEYGSSIPGYPETLANPTKKNDDKYHYEFAGWNITSGTVKGETIIRPVFDGIEHNYSKDMTTEPTCTQAGKVVKKCNKEGCDAELVVVTTKPALGHTDKREDGTKVEHTIIQPTIELEGKDSYNCARCGALVEKTIAKLVPFDIIITVYDAEGNLATNGVATVTITNKATGESFSTNTNENGQAIFNNMPSGQEWSVSIVGNTLPKGGYGGDLNADGTFTGGNSKEEEDTNIPTSCSCSCHKKSFWGIMFRMFQKIIKLFTGEIRCCDDPDPKYFK